MVYCLADQGLLGLEWDVVVETVKLDLFGE